MKVIITKDERSDIKSHFKDNGIAITNIDINSFFDDFLFSKLSSTLFDDMNVFFENEKYKQERKENAKKEYENFMKIGYDMDNSQIEREKALHNADRLNALYNFTRY